MPKSHPRGWNAGVTETRFSDVAPASYDQKARSVECVISVGSPVKRYFGTELLRIHSDAVKLDRMKSSGIPLLDSHQQVGLSNHLGRFVDTWITSGAKPSLMGRIVFERYAGRSQGRGHDRAQRDRRNLRWLSRQMIGKSKTAMVA